MLWLIFFRRKYFKINSQVFCLILDLKIKLIDKNLIKIAKKTDFNIKIFVFPPTQVNLHSKQPFLIIDDDFEICILWKKISDQVLYTKKILWKKSQKIFFRSADFRERRVVTKNLTVPVSEIIFWTIWVKKVSKKSCSIFVKVGLR